MATKNMIAQALTSQELTARLDSAAEFNKTEAARVEASGGVFLAIAERKALAADGYTEAEIEAIANGTFTE